MKPNKISSYFALGSYLQKYYPVSVSAESSQAVLQSCECFCHACYFMNMLLCLSLLMDHHMSENMLVLLKAVRWWSVVNMPSEPADTKHTVLFKHSNTGGNTRTFPSAICHANDSCCHRDHQNEKWRWRSRRCLVSRWRRMTGQRRRSCVRKP